MIAAARRVFGMCRLAECIVVVATQNNISAPTLALALDWPLLLHAPSPLAAIGLLIVPLSFRSTNAGQFIMPGVIDGNGFEKMQDSESMMCVCVFP